MLKQYFSNNNKIVSSTYDELNRLTNRTIQTSTGVLGATSETYTYDELGRLINGNDNLNNPVSFNYDSLNRLINETNNNENTNYTYDQNSNITSINNTNYSYDIANRLQTIKNGTESIANYTYNSLTQTKQTLGNGVITNYSYDELLRLSTLGNYNYTYNTQGNITNDGKDSYTYDILGRLTSVNYDKVNTPGYNGDKIERFYYDNVGNRTNQENYTLKETSTETCSDETVVEDITLPNGKTKTVERKQRKCETAVTQTEKQKNTLTYNTNQLNQYTKLQNLNKNGEVKKEFTYNYDKNGNLTKDDINQYFYDYKNRLVKVIQNEVIKVDENGNILETIPEKEIVKYSYDVLGRRTTKQTQEEKINYIYAGQNAIQENIYTQSGTTLTLKETRQNIYSNNLDDILFTIVVDEINQTSKQYYYEKNHLGSITKITDELGAIVEQYEYDVFGTAYANVNNVEAVTEAQSNKTLSIKKSDGSETASQGDSEEITINNIRYKRYNGVGKIWNMPGPKGGNTLGVRDCIQVESMMQNGNYII
ncbi:MAG: hypothetical protein PHS49_00360 [Candidatus Gracilibacteria bacterium]|nr:hypothetical protein [Candidatus Gracilibacteria bacterium]